MTADLSKYDETVSTARRWATQSDRDIFTTASKVEHALVAYADALAEAEKRLAAVEDLHRPFGIWDECDCDDEALNDDATHRDVDEVGRTCNKLYDICSECCTDGGYMTEACAEHHDHRPGMAICPTIIAAARADL